MAPTSGQAGPMLGACGRNGIPKMLDSAACEGRDGDGHPTRPAV